ncbi:MAG: bifunctional DNA-binding transcriptional regulator/O6-methylguanine-DNA methyltransferase Ada [Burkholderiaceae bacterium]
MNAPIMQGLQVNTADDDASRLAAVRARDPAADGRFVYAVTTTGVYCRPSCGSRPARVENMRFFAGPEPAEQAGFRPCKRCHPQIALADAGERRRIVAACRLIEGAPSAPSLAELAANAGLGEHHFHRLFKRALGVTPRAYAQAVRRGRLNQSLADEPSVTDAIYAAGYNSSGRFYEEAQAALGMQARTHRAAGAGETIRFAVGQCWLGSVLVAATAIGVCAISIGDDPQALVDELQARFANAELIGDDPAFADHIAHVVGFIDGRRDTLDLPLDIRGTAFQQRIWQALREIPAGRTLSYSALAEALGMPRSTRAIAAACAANTLAVAIPCHRVVRADGGLAGYRWGIQRKRALLDREAARS